MASQTRLRYRYWLLSIHLQCRSILRCLPHQNLNRIHTYIKRNAIVRHFATRKGEHQKANGKKKEERVFISKSLNASCFKRLRIKEKITSSAYRGRRIKCPFRRFGGGCRNLRIDFVENALRQMHGIVAIEHGYRHRFVLGNRFMKKFQFHLNGIYIFLFGSFVSNIFFRVIRQINFEVIGFSIGRRLIIFNAEQVAFLFKNPC